MTKAHGRRKGGGNMLHLLREGEEINRPAPGEDDGSLEFVPTAPSLIIRSSALDVSETDALQRQLLGELATATFHMEAAPQAPAPSADLIHAQAGWLQSVKVDLRHLPVSRAERERLEGQIGRRVAELLMNAQDIESATRASACVATSPGDLLSITQEIRDLIANPPAEIDPNLPITILVVPPSGDVLTLEVFPSTTRTLPPNEVRVGLATGVDWAKQIVAWTVCPPHHHQYVRRDSKGLAQWMTVTRADNIDLLVFRKPKIFGTWFDIFHFDMNEFIDTFGGRFNRFTWHYD
jgi:hypothetical protein